MMEFKVGDKVKIDEVESHYHRRWGIVIGDAFCPTFPYKVEFDDGDDCIFKGKDLILLSTEEEKVMKFKVGDRVQVVAQYSAFYGDKGTVIENDGTDNLPIHVKFDVDRCVCWFYENDLKVLHEEETSMKFKVGDKVKVKDSWFGHDGQVGVVFKIDNYEPYNYNIKFDTEGDNERRDENFMGDSLELVTEEEKVMKFKVGDKVKVSNSWEGRSGEVGEITRRNIWEAYPCRVTFEDGVYESFKEEEIELVKEKAEKQSFTKSDLKTGMGVVLRNGRKGHVLVDTGCVDVIRFLENGNYSCLNDFSDDLTSNYKEEHDIVEVYFTEYQFKLLTDQVFDQDCVFKREEPKPEPEPTKMTMKEINEHFGKPIEIIE